MILQPKKSAVGRIPLFVEIQINKNVVDDDQTLDFVQTMIDKLQRVDYQTVISTNWVILDNLQ